MEQLLLIILCIFKCLAQNTTPKCDYDNTIRTYTCKGIKNVFPNIFYGNYHLHCVECDIEVFSNATFPFSNSLVSLNVSNSGIEHIRSNALSIFSNAQYLYFQNNKISEIAPEAFSGLRQVYELHLENNQLKNLLPGFLANVEVNTVSLSNNQIKYLQNGPFEASLGVLVLDLSNNLIKLLKEDAFFSLETLEILNLENNRICHIPLGIFRNLSSLRHLNLARNKLTKLSYGTFSGLRFLSILNLSNNSLVNFDANVLISFSHLSRLDISANGIYYFDANSIHSNVPTLRTLRMEDNLLACTHLINIIQYFKTVSVEVVTIQGRYHVQNINGIACSELILDHTVDFDQFLKLVKIETENNLKNC